MDERSNKQSILPKIGKELIAIIFIFGKKREKIKLKQNNNKSIKI